MKKSVKRIIIGLGSVLALLIIVCGIFMFMAQTEISKMKSLDTKEVTTGIYAISEDYVNFYLIKCKDKYIAIDAGDDIEKIKVEMKKINIDPQKVAAVFLTHTDSDHVGAIKLFKNAKIYLSEDEEQMINGKTTRIFVFKNKPPAKYELLKDNQIKNILGVKIKAISTPGHTPGSVCYLVDDKYLFIGDNMSLINGEAGLFNSLFNMDPDTQKISLKKLAQLSGIKYIFTAHYGLSDNYEKAFKKWK